MVETDLVFCHQPIFYFASHLLCFDVFLVPSKQERYLEMQKQFKDGTWYKSRLYPERSESPKIGGLILDEMYIHSGLLLQPHGEGLSMSVFMDFGEENSGTHTMFHQGKPLEVATSVLHFIFLSLNRFRCSFTYMFCKGVFTGELNTIIIDIFQTLASYEFKMFYIWMGQPSTCAQAIPSLLAHLQ